MEIGSEVKEYSDGAQVEAQIQQIIELNENRSSTQFLGSNFYSHWTIKYHLSPERSNLLRIFNWTNLSVLEVGAGLGGVSRFLSENVEKLTCLEPTKSRFEALKSRLLGLNNWEAQNLGFQNYIIDKKFDIVTSIGVLEYAETYFAPQSRTPHIDFLVKARAHLKPGGILLIAIENRLGLKYWSGCVEDHSGGLYSGIVGYHPNVQARTFSKKELTELLRTAGFRTVKFYYPYPDYKLPKVILSEELAKLEPELFSHLAAVVPYETFPFQRLLLGNDQLIQESLASSGLLEEFANSFLILASPEDSSYVLDQLIKKQSSSIPVAWKYNLERSVPICTHFCKDGNILKESLIPEEAILSNFHIKLPIHDKIKSGKPLILKIARNIYFNQWEETWKMIEHFFDYSFNYWETTDLSTISGKSLDATFSNTLILQDNTYFNFDKEWEVEGSISKTWFIFRNILNLNSYKSSLFFSTFRSLFEIYNYYCLKFNLNPNYISDLNSEVDFQTKATRVLSKEHTKEILKTVIQQPFQRDHTFINNIVDFLVLTKDHEKKMSEILKDKEKLHQQIKQTQLELEEIKKENEILNNLGLLDYIKLFWNNKLR